MSWSVFWFAGVFVSYFFVSWWLAGICMGVWLVVLYRESYPRRP
jgi:hypothetical protein